MAANKTKTKTTKSKKEAQAKKETPAAAAGLGGHGTLHLPSVEIDAYNAEVKDEDGFVGDRASGSAFRAIVEDWRKRIEDKGEPLLDKGRVKKQNLDRIINEGEIAALGLVMSAIEDFSQGFSTVIRRYLKLKAWENTDRIVVGGGLRDSRIGEMVVARTGAILKEKDIDIPLSVIRHHPDEAGLVGAAHLAPSWILEGYDAILAVDIGGSNIRCGVVELKLDKAPDLSKSAVCEIELWRHRDEDTSRTAAVERTVDMLSDLLKRAKHRKMKVAPFVGIGCPGVIDPDGTIERGAQNLPGDWTSEAFHLPDAIARGLGKIGGHEAAILLHNDAVVQGLSETPFMQDVKRWGVLTIGTGLGNARFTNRTSA